MARPNNIEGGFGGYNRIDIESQQYETISKFSLNSSKEEYVDSIMQAAGLRGTKHKKRLQRYYDENNDQLINPQQNSLSQSRFRTVVEGISNQQKSNAGISGEYNDYTKVSSGDQVLDKIIDQNIRNSINPEGKKNVQIDELDDVINTEQSTLSPGQQARVDNYQSRYPTRPANNNDYFRGYTLPEWLHIEVDSEEHNKLKEAIKELGVMPKLGELDTNIKAQHQSNEISGNYLSFINATRELYGLNPLQTTAEVEESQESLPYDSGVESTPVEGEAQSQYYIVEGSRFNLARYNGDDEIRLAMIKDDLSELGISDTELDGLISSRGFPDIPSKSIKIGDKIVDWDDEDPESRLSYRESAIAEYYGIDTNKGMFTDETQATEDENIRKKITYGNMNNEAWKNLNTGETSQTFGHLPDPNTEEESTIEGRATRRRSSAQEGDISSTDQTNPDLDELQSELSRLVAEAAIELSKEQGGAIVRASDEASKTFEPNLDILYQQLNSNIINPSESGKLARVEGDIYPGEVELETVHNSIEINSVKEKVLEAISDYQKFININRNNLRDEKIYNEYRIIENTAWFHVGRFIHKLGGEIATLPQERDIQLAHPEVVDIKEYLVNEEKITLDEEDNITHLNIYGNIIELNRPRTIEELLKAKRPTHILYHSGTPISEDDPTKQNYRGLLIDGLNEDTLKLIEGVLNKKETVIVDETKTVSEELLGQTPDNVVEELEPTVGVEPKTEQPEVETADIPQTHPDFGSVYYQESQRWNYLQSLEEQYRDNPKDKEIEKDLTEMRKTYQEFIDRINNDPNQDKFRDFLALRQSYAKEEASNTMDRFRKAIGLSQHNETELALSRERYNTALQELLKTEVSDKVSLNIKQLFSDEFGRLRDERAQQTRELKGPETRIDRLKNKFLKFATKHKSIISGVNFLLLGGSLFAAGTGIGIPVAGAMDVSRRFIGGVMAGVSGRETIRSNFEDLNTDLNVNLTKGINIKTNFNILKSNNKDRNLNLNIKGINFKTNFERLKTKGAITKLVEKSLKGDYINKASDTELLKIISTLDAYYGLNGGRFTESNQQKAYEMATYALGKKVENSIQPNSETSDTLDANSTSSKDEVSIESNSNTQDIAQSPDYMNELLTRVSIDRVRELNKQKNIRLGANTAGFLIGGTLLGSLAADMHRPGGVFNPNDNPDAGASVPKTEPGSGTGGAPTGESVPPNPSTGPEITPGDTPPSAPDAPPTGSGGEALSQSDQLAQSTEATKATAEQAAEQTAEQLAQDVSSLDPGETIWGEVAKQLGENATDAQIQQAVENLLQSEVGQDSIYKLAQGTEGGRALLAQWGIDNATEMAELSKEQLYEISRYLAPGELQGITELSLDNLTPFEAAEPPQVDVSEAMDNSTPATEASAPSVEPTLSAAPEATDSPEVSPIAGTEFTENLSKALGANGLTESQLQNVIYSFATSENGSAELYNQIISNDEGVRFLSGFGVNSAADFANLRPDELYEIAQTVGVDNLDKLPGFELNDIILSKFENAPDTVELIRGSRPLDVVNQYIANELGNLPYDSTLGQQVLNTYINTPAGKEWLYESIVSNPNPNNQNVQMFREYLSFKGIKSAEEFKQTFDWAEFSGNRRIPTSAFWNYTRLPNGNMRIAPLSTFLQPGEMPGIKKALGLVLIKQ